MAAARDRGLYSAVTTNGLNLGVRGPALADAGLDEIFVSLDGPDEVHDRIRGRRGSFRRAVEGLERLAVHPARPRMSVHCVLTPWNVGHLVRFVEAVRHLPLERVGFMHPNFTTPEMAAAHNRRWGELHPATPSNLGPLQPGEMDLDRLLGELGALRDLELPFSLTLSPSLTDREGLERFYLRPGEPIGRGCSDVHRTLMIKSDGVAIPAHGRCYETPVGRVGRQTLPEIWNSAAMARLRRDLARAGGLLPACTRCCSAF